MNINDSHLMNVSRETEEKFSLFLSLLLKWNKTHNLVAGSTETDALNRHIVDSYQLVQYLPKNTVDILDFGSGAGFPGLILAMSTRHHLILCEKSAKRTAFLRYVSRETKTDVEVFDRDLADDERTYDVVVSRAVTNLQRLWDLCGHRLNTGGYCLFLKGAGYREELEKFNSNMDVTIEIFPSITNKDSVIIKMYKR